MSVPPEVAKTVREWVAHADQDLAVAELAAADDRFRPYPVACYLAQQCAEKYLKALLVLHSIPFRKTHDLAHLLRRLPPSVDLGLDRSSLTRLTFYAESRRYPGDWPPVERAEAVSAVEVARDVKAAVRLRLPEEALPEEEYPLP